MIGDHFFLKSYQSANEKAECMFGVEFSNITGSGFAVAKSIALATEFIKHCPTSEAPRISVQMHRWYIDVTLAAAILHHFPRHFFFFLSLEV